MQTRIIYELGFNQNHNTFAFSLMKIVLCSTIKPCRIVVILIETKLIMHTCLHMKSVTPLVACQALSGRFEFMVRRHKLNEESLSGVTD